MRWQGYAIMAVYTLTLAGMFATKQNNWFWLFLALQVADVLWFGWIVRTDAKPPQGDNKEETE